MMNNELLYIGTYTEDIKFGTGQILEARGEGIYLYRLNREDGTLEYLNVFSGIRNPSYLVFSPCNRYMYAVNELKEFEGKPSGSISAFSVDRKSGKIEFINSLPTHGTDPCYVSTDDTGAFVFVANYMSGSVAVYKTGEDGGLACLSDFIQHSGFSVDKARQTGPHAHAAVFNKDTKQLYVPDLGLDCVVVYSLDTESGKLNEESMLQVKTDPGAGPRYLEFRHDMKFAYLVNELNSTVTALRNDQAEKKLVPFQTVSTLPEGFNGKSDSADLHITPSGSFLYASNRGHDSIGCFRIDPETGLLESLGHVPCGGRTPRNFLIDPEGRYLIVANQDSNLLNVFSINENTGMLDFTGNTAGIFNPVCIRTQS